MARWLMAYLRSIGVHADLEPGQEDFGWYFDFVVEGRAHCFVIGSRPSEDGGVDWIGWLERKRGLAGSLLGLRATGVSAAARRTIHAALSHSSEVAVIRWHEKARFDRGEENPGTGERYRCPCCCYKTLPTRGDFQICPVCFWEDDGQDEQDATEVRGGPNGALSLLQARMNFRELGSCERRSLPHVRPPHPDEQ